MNKCCWDLPAIMRAQWLARRIVTTIFAGLQHADQEELVAEALSISLAANTQRPDIHYLCYRLLLKCVRSAGLRLGLITIRGSASPAMIRLSDLADRYVCIIPEIEIAIYRENVVDINIWKAQRAAQRKGAA